MKSLYLIIFIIFFFVEQAYSACNRGEVQITNLNPVVIDFTSTNNQIVNFQVSHPPFTGSTDCFYLGVISYGQSNNFSNRVMTEIVSSNQIPFNVNKGLPVSATNIIRDLFDVTSNNHIIYLPIFTASASSQTNSHSFISQLGSLPVNLSPGLYSEALVLKIAARPVTGSPGPITTWPIVAETALQFMYNVERVISLAIVPTGTPHNDADKSELMSFGILSTGRTLSADITIDTNVGYRLFMSSMNDGRLEHETEPANVPYTLTLSGANINLTGSSTTPVQVSANSASSPAGGYRLPVSVTIGTVSGNEISGRYSDVITTTVEAF